MNNNNDYYTKLNSNLIRALEPLEGKRVLEIGCGAGVLGKHLKEKGATYYAGVEKFPDAAAQAAQVLDEVVSGDVERFDFAFPVESFDYIVFGDVLEHLVAPWQTLQHCYKVLKPSGFMVASIPNANHIFIFMSLMMGKWEYQDSGLLDRTHLRFFTLDSILQMFQNVGMNVVNVESIPGVSEDEKILVETLDIVRQKFKLDNPRFKTEAQTFQWVVKAQKGPKS